MFKFSICCRLIQSIDTNLYIQNDRINRIYNVHLKGRDIDEHSLLLLFNVSSAFKIIS